MESNLGVRVGGHLRELAGQFGSFRQVGLSQANCIFADTWNGIIKRPCDEARVKFLQAIERPQSVHAPQRRRTLLEELT